MAILFRTFLVLFYFLMIVCYLTNVLHKASFLVPDNKQCVCLKKLFQKLKISFKHKTLYGNIFALNSQTGYNYKLFVQNVRCKICVV